LCNDFGNTLNSIGKHSEALDFSQRALRIRREVLGESHPDTTTSLSGVAYALCELGNYRQSLEYEQRVLEIPPRDLRRKAP